jgi:hypothetical protein
VARAGHISIFTTIDERGKAMPWTSQVVRSCLWVLRGGREGGGVARASNESVDATRYLLTYFCTGCAWLANKMAYLTGNLPTK